MKILWFTLTPCGASEQLCPDSQGGGWLASLEKHLIFSGQVDLHICFHCDTDIPSFTSGGVTYHPTRRLRMKNKLLGHFLRRNLQQNTIQVYEKVISKVKPDLIHVHGTEEDFGLIQSITDVPVIISLQGILTNYISKYFSGISFARLFVNENWIKHMKLKSILTNYAIFRENATRERVILSMAKHVIGRTAWDHRSATVMAPNAQYHHGDEILRNPFYEGVWSKQFFSSPFRIVTVSSVAPYKGFETVLKVSRILKEQVGLDFSWNVIGLSLNDSSVKVAYKWLGEQKKVHLLGTLTGIEIRNILLESDIFCQVSHIENSPNSLCEAMLVGIPIVASFAGGTDSMLCSGKEGILVQDGDPLSMAGAILELSHDFKLATKMGQAARFRALHRHNPDRIVKDLLSIYRRISQHQNQ